MGKVNKATPINLSEYEALAREYLTDVAYDFFAGGANDELTIAENLKAWQKIRLLPRVLVDISDVNLTTTVLGHEINLPVLIAPCGFNKLAHPDGECAVTRAAKALNTIHIVSTASTSTLEEIAANAPDAKRWFQLYCYKDRNITQSLVERAEAADYRALCLTVDVPLAGRRERDIRNRFDLPAGIKWANLENAGLEKMTKSTDDSALHKYINEVWDDSLTWDILDWLKSITKLPVIVKGILHPDDARLAIQHGVAAIIVSNHGGRQLDGAISSCDALPAIAETVNGQVEIFVDGGIRRGADVLKALALGAKAVLIGRPYLWGLAVGGEAGVKHVFDLLYHEIKLAMALVGRTSIRQIDKDMIVLP